MTPTMTGSERVAELFARAKSEGRGAIIPYLVAGDPDAATTEAVIAAITEAGADLIELGIPFSDPIADGPTIAAAAKRALDGGMTVDRALEIAARVRERGSAPILFFTYLNPILNYGLERFAERVREVGACGAIVPDVPMEESEELGKLFARYGLVLPMLVAPTTPLERAVRLAEVGDGFVYIVSRLGVTGAKREPDFPWIAERVEQLRTRTKRPLAVGFGIATPAHVRTVLERADGAIVGSALLDAIVGIQGAKAGEAAGKYIASLRKENC